MAAKRDRYQEHHEDPKVGWKNRVRYAEDRSGRSFAYRPHEVLTTRPTEALRVAKAAFPDHRIAVASALGPFSRLTGVPDPLRLIEELRLAGIVAQPNHVLFIHCECCPPHPATGCGWGFGYGLNPATINPATINPATINPATINPATINPATINPATINPNAVSRVTGFRRSSARPAAPEPGDVKTLGERICAPVAKGAPRVFVLDTGLPKVDPPATLAAAPGIQGDAADEPDNDRNKMLDPGAGHGTFIAGVINQVAPGCNLTVHQVATGYGDVDEVGASTFIAQLHSDDRTILSLSFGGAVMDNDAAQLAWAVRGFQAGGGVVVASAGNDGSCLPAYPAALPGVISVGALASWGPASFTNYGPWVRACAPGVDLLSLFFEGFDGSLGAGADGADQDKFEGWAYWSGTSFAGPVVVGALARMMMWAGCTAADAVARVIDAPALLRIPNLGTVVNVI